MARTAAPAASDPQHDPTTGHGLVLPAEGDRTLARMHARQLGRNRALFPALSAHLPPALRAAHARAVALVERACARDLRAALQPFASPTVATPLRCLALRDDLPALRERIDAAARDATPHLLLELALRGLIPPGEAVDWPARPERLSSLSLGAALVPPAECAGLRFASGALRATRADGGECGRIALGGEAPDERAGFGVEFPYRRVGRITRLALRDHNPISAFEAHPDKSGNPTDLGGHSEDAWVSALATALDVIVAHLPGYEHEMRLLLHELVPVGYHESRHLSASYREAIGTIYLTLHPNVMTMAEALVHEFQHNKLNLAAYEAEFLFNAYHPRYPSPVRPDPRPLWGILLAVHAFLPVAALYRAMRAAGHPRAASPDFARRLAEIDAKNHEGMSMLLAHGEFTPAGRVLIDELAAMDRAHLADADGTTGGGVAGAHWEE